MSVSSMIRRVSTVTVQTVTLLLIGAAIVKSTISFGAHQSRFILEINVKVSSLDANQTHPAASPAIGRQGENANAALSFSPESLQLEKFVRRS